MIFAQWVFWCCSQFCQFRAEKSHGRPRNCSSQEIFSLFKKITINLEKEKKLGNCLRNLKSFLVFVESASVCREHGSLRMASSLVPQSADDSHQQRWRLLNSKRRHSIQVSSPVTRQYSVSDFKPPPVNNKNRRQSISESLQSITKTMSRYRTINQKNLGQSAHIFQLPSQSHALGEQSQFGQSSAD